MYIRNRIVSLVFKLLLLGASGYGILVNSGLLSGAFQPGAFVYFTILSNLFFFLCTFVEIICLIVGLAKKSLNGPSGLSPTIKGATVIALLLTMIAYQLLLAPTLAEIAGGTGQAVIEDAFGSTVILMGFPNAMVHLIVPLLALADWILFCPKGSFRFTDPLAWLLPPIFYFGFVVIRARMGDIYYGKSSYPYGFIDINVLGWVQVLWNVSILVLAIFVMGCLFVLLDQLLGLLVKKTPPQEDEPPEGDDPPPPPRRGGKRAAALEYADADSGAPLPAPPPRDDFEHRLEAVAPLGQPDIDYRNHREDPFADEYDVPGKQYEPPAQNGGQYILPPAGGQSARARAATAAFAAIQSTASFAAVRPDAPPPGAAAPHDDFYGVPAPQEPALREPRQGPPVQPAWEAAPYEPYADPAPQTYDTPAPQYAYYDAPPIPEKGPAPYQPYSEPARQGDPYVSMPPTESASVPYAYDASPAPARGSAPHQPYSEPAWQDDPYVSIPPTESASAPYAYDTPPPSVYENRHIAYAAPAAAAYPPPQQGDEAAPLYRRPAHRPGSAYAETPALQAFEDTLPPAAQEPAYAAYAQNPYAAPEPEPAYTAYEQSPYAAPKPEPTYAAYEQSPYAAPEPESAYATYERSPYAAPEPEPAYAAYEQNPYAAPEPELAYATRRQNPYAAPEPTAFYPPAGEPNPAQNFRRLTPDNPAPFAPSQADTHWEAQMPPAAPYTPARPTSRPHPNVKQFGTDAANTPDNP